MRVGLYARVSSYDQQTLPLQLDAIRSYVRNRGWKAVVEVQDIGSGSHDRPKRKILLDAARRRELDTIIVWRLERWGRSLVDLVVSLQELTELGVGFISLMEAVDLTTPTGRALAGLLAVFAEFERKILRERVKAGIDRARKPGRPHGRPATAMKQSEKVKRLHSEGLSKAAIARQVGIGRTSVRRILQSEGLGRAASDGN